MNYVISEDVVSQCFKRLRSQRVHEHFPGYLCVLRRAAQLNRRDDLDPNFQEFFDQFFLVRNHPPKTPYIKPFTSQQGGKGKLWLNRNVAGSFAPSSLRQTLLKVLDVNDEKKYSLPKDHAQSALAYLLFSKQIQVADLAVFLYRDYGLEGAQFGINDLVDVFAYEFGYMSEPNGQRDSDFHLLYRLESIKLFGRDWLEPA